MKTSFPHLPELRSLASDARRDATKLQRRLTAKMTAGDPISHEEMFAVQSLMQLSATVQALYLREVERSSLAALPAAKRPPIG